MLDGLLVRTVGRMDDDSNDGVRDPARRYQAWGPVGATEVSFTDSTIELLDRLVGFDEPVSAWALDETAHAPTRKHEGRCRVCGNTFSMTFEHFPPKTMGNNSKVRRAPAQAALESDDPLAFPHHASYQVQRGSGAHVLCGDCNSYSGTHYVPAMAAFAEIVQGRVESHIASTGHVPGILGLSLDEWPLGDIARAGLVSVMAQGVHDRLLRAYPDLRKVVLEGEIGLPADLRLGLTYIASGRVRAAPAHALRTKRGETVFMEMAAPPLAWTLSFLGDGRVPLDRTADVSSWLDTPADVLAEPTGLELPVGSVDSPLGADYRPAALIREEMARQAGARQPRTSF